MSTEGSGNVELPVDQDGIRCGVQTKLTKLAEGMKQMTSSITMLVKAINPTSAVAQSDLIDSGADPQTVQGVVDPQKVIELEAS